MKLAKSLLSSLISLAVFAPAALAVEGSTAAPPAETINTGSTGNSGGTRGCAPMETTPTPATSPEASADKPMTPVTGSTGSPTAEQQSPAKLEPDYFSQISTAGVTRWPDKRMPIKVFITKGDSVPGYRREFETIVRQALNDWQAASDGKIKFTTASNEKQSDLLIAWTNDRARMTSKEEDGHAVLIPDADGILRAEILLLTVPSPTVPSMSDRYARRVALHEIGHALGFSGHSSESSDIMFRTVDPQDRDPIISDRDRKTLAALYKSGVREMTTAGSAGAPTGGSAEMQAIRLSNEAVAAMNKNDLKTALSKLEEAHKIDPKNGMVNSNLGSLYANLAAMAGMVRNFPMSESYFKLALPLLEQGPNKTAFASVLQNYSSVLRMMNKPQDAQKMEERLKQVQSGK